MTVAELDKAHELCEKLLFINASDATNIAPGTFRHHLQPPFDKKYFEKLKAGDVNCIHTSFLCWFYDDFYMSMKRVSYLYKLLDLFKNDLKLVEKVDDIARARLEKRIGVIMHFHNSSMIDDDLAFLAIHHRLGLRVMQLSYQSRTLLCDGTGEDTDAGLSAMGIKAIDEMNRLGILVDVAHAGHKSALEAIERSRVPVICSHGALYSIHDNDRNIKDDLLQAIAEKGGVMGIMSKPTNLRPNGGLEGATIQDYVNHIEHIVKLVGVDHAGIGLENGYDRNSEDYEIMNSMFRERFISKRQQEMLVPQYNDFDKVYSADGVKDPSTAKFNIICELLKRGYSEQEIAKILGENFVRVYRQVWK
jgi:membrane dipeptidase